MLCSLHGAEPSQLPPPPLACACTICCGRVAALESKLAAAQAELSAAKEAVTKAKAEGHRAKADAEDAARASTNCCVSCCARTHVQLSCFSRGLVGCTWFASVAWSMVKYLDTVAWAGLVPQVSRRSCEAASQRWRLPLRLPSRPSARPGRRWRQLGQRRRLPKPPWTLTSRHLTSMGP
jgi:hypothetical protein